MTRRDFIYTSAVLSSGLMVGCSSKKNIKVTKSVKMIFINGEFYTLNSNQEWAEAMVIEDGIIKYIGSNDGVDKYKDNITKIIDLKGKFIMPSFVESHLHPLSTAYDRNFKASLYGLNSVDEYIDKITKFANDNPDMKGIMGSGFVRTFFDKIGPKKELLDAIDSTRPIGIVSSDIHSMWVNSKVLEMLNITKDTLNPSGGVIVKDPITGEPTGLLQEDSTMSLAWDLFPQATKEQYKESLLIAQQQMNKLGITTAHDAWMEFDPNFYEAYDELAKEGKLTVRFRGSWYITPPKYDNVKAVTCGCGGMHGHNEACGEFSCFEQIEYGVELSNKFTHPHFQVNSFKFLADNILEEQTALLLEPYTNRPNFYGIQNWEEEDLYLAFKKVNDEQYQIHVHTIGDGASKITIDAIEKLENSKENRHSLAHIQMIRDEDILRMGKLELSAHLSQTWMVMNEDYDNVYLPYLGKKRADKTYLQKSMFDANVNVTVSSDLPTSEPDIMLAIYSGMTRTGEDGEQLEPINQCVSLPQMLQASTINGAYSNFLEDEIGTLEVGKKADMVVLSDNLFEIDTDEIPKVQIKMTFFEGVEVYRK